ncbi:LuxR family transcriptional regulator [Phenylobacterium sp.]|uniref:LuxR family transcriptional regulator n=1 Tax=Phenylobacterium sp. TaxID=1871053 RepID=UPI0035B145B4
MSRFHDVQTFVREANRVTRREELYGLVDGVVRELDFDYFSLVQHADVASTPPQDFVHLVSFPKAWREMVMARGYFADDPVHVACQKTARGFLWSSAGQIIDLTPRQHEILRAAAAEGLGDGFAVPIHLPGELGGSCSFGLRLGREASAESLPMMQYVGCFAFEAARRIMKADRGRARAASGPPRLTDRQLDCMVLAAGGGTDAQIAGRLGISEKTVHQHVEEAKRRYGVSTRTLLVVRALFDGQITFADIFRTLH